jgi:hypothetical protein
MMTRSSFSAINWLRMPVALLISFTLSVIDTNSVAAQDNSPPPLRLDGVQPGGVRRTATESWGSFDFQVTNSSEIDRQARVVCFYEGQPDIQYARELWVPAHSTLSTWMLVGPSSTQESGVFRDIQMLLYDRTGGQDLLMLPRTEERYRARGVLYRKREPTTVVLLDDQPEEGQVFGRLPPPDSLSVEAVRLVRTFRCAAQLSGTVLTLTSSQLVPHGSLVPPNPEAFEGIDHFVLASRRILNDPLGLSSLRHWVEQGGKLWVMLDLLDLDVVAPFLGDALDFQMADRISLTSFRVDSPTAGRGNSPKLQQYEQAVTFSRIVLPRDERPRYTIDGWPVWFTRPYGKGKIIFTTLGPRGWHRPRKTPPDSPSPFELYSELPVPESHLQRLADELHLPQEEDPFDAHIFGPQLIDDIGYAVPARATVAWIFAGFVLVAFALGLFLRRIGWLTLQGWLAPAAALIVGVGFLAAGHWSRRAAAPTVAVAQIVEGVAGKDEAAVHGILAAYRPDSGPAEISGTRGSFDLDMGGLEGQTRRYVQTDMESWKWENLALPGGVRHAPFRFTASTGEPISAIAHLGPDGIEGRLAHGPFQGVTDALLATPGGRHMAIRLQPDGRFRSASADVLPPGLFLADAVLTDEQQRRQEVYREFLRKPRWDRSDGHPLLMAWAKPIDAGFRIVPDGRLVGTALLVIPLRFTRPEKGSHVTIPAPLVSWQRVLPGGLGKPVLDSTSEADQLLRFQLPFESLPLKVERARLTAKVEAPSRRITIAAGGDGQQVVLHQVESPLDLVRVDIVDSRLLQLDEQGGLVLNVRINDPPLAGGTPQKWRIEYIDLEISGRAE